MNRCDEIPVLRNRRPKNTGKTGESHGNGGDGSGLNDGEESPAKEEPENGRERLAQVDVHTSRPRHHRCQFPIGERGGNREDGGDAPGHQQPAGAADVARHVRRNDKNSRADHDSHGDHHRIEQAEFADEAGLAIDGDVVSGFYAHAGMPQQKGSRSSSTSSDCAVTKAEPRINGMTWPSMSSMRPSNMLPVILSCFQTSPGWSRPSAYRQAIFALVPVPQGERS